MIRKLTISILVVSYTIGFKAYSQNKIDFKVVSDSLYNVFYDIRNFNDYNKRVVLSEKAEKIFDSVLWDNESFSFPFDTLKNLITCLYSDDKACRIINWNIPRPDASYIYFGYVQYFDKKNKKLTTTKLTDYHHMIDNPEQIVLQPDKWYGALYYEIIPTLVHKSEIVYALIGWEGYSLRANRKIIDIMRFKNGTPYFGYGIFKTTNGNKSRIVFTYNYRAKMKVGWDKNIGMIIFDKLERIPTMPADAEGNMAPTMLYDGFKWEDNIWKYQSNIDIKPQKKRKSKTISYPYK